jgi:predicted permease
MAERHPQHRQTAFRWLIQFIGLIVPRRLRADWRQEWEAELLWREHQLAQWDKLNWQNKFELWRRSLGAFTDALCLQPRRLEDEMFQDLRFGARMLLKNKGFTLVIIITLALGIGVNTAIFGLVDAAFFRPLPLVAQPDRLLRLVRNNSEGRGEGWGLSYPDFKILREHQQVLSALALYNTMRPLSLGHHTRSEVVQGALVSGNYFDVLGLRPALGRGFLPEEDRTPDTHPVVVLSHSFWQNRFDSDPALIGQSIVLNNRRFTVVGVMPPGFDGQEPEFKTKLWIPLMMIGATPLPPTDSGPVRDPLNNPQFRFFGALARVKDGVTVAQAEAALTALLHQIKSNDPAASRERAATQPMPVLKLVQPRGITNGVLRDGAVTASRLLMATVITVLLIACANVANLLLARAATRRKEIAVRLALGATRWRLVRQLLTESVLLALLGAAAGLLLASWLNQLLMTFKPPFPSLFTVTLDLFVDRRAFAFTFLLALVTGVLFGLFPALQASKPDVVPALKDEAESTRGHWLNLRGALVVTQVALSLALLISLGLFLRSLNYTRHLDLGFEPENVLEATFDLEFQGYDETKGREFYRQLIPRLAALPGVQSAAVTNILPLGFWAPRASVMAEGQQLPENERPSAANFAVGPRYFETIGTPLLHGRDFTPQDTSAALPVAIVSEALAHRVWPDIKAAAAVLGQRLQVGTTTYQVIGIAKDSENNIFNAFDNKVEPTLYRAFAQNYPFRASVVVRTSGDPRELIPAVRREVAALDENLPAQDLQPLTETTKLATWTTRTDATVFALFGLLGLLVAGVGIYGVMSYTVAQRKHEIGIRLALGAQARDIITLIVKQGMVLVLLGILLGVVLAVWATRGLASLLIGIAATDPLTYAGVAFFLISVTLLACYLPARRATKVDPLTALRHE